MASIPAEPVSATTSSSPVIEMMSALLPVHRAVTVAWLADAAATAAERGLAASYTLLYIEQQDGRLEHLAPASDLRRRSHQRANDAFGGKLRRGIEPARSLTLTQALDADEVSTISPAELFDGIDDVAAHTARKAIGIERVALVPLETAGERVGALVLMLTREADDAVLKLLGEHIACAIVNLRAAENARERGVTDVVRSVFDARKLEADLQRELARAVRHKREVSIVIIEATNLRLLRDQFGAFLTDRLLQRLGEALAQHARDIDVIGAYKESGYTMILAEAESEGAATAARRLLERAHEIRVDGPEVPGLELHLVAGWASCPADGATTDSLFAAAEVRMYEAAA